MKERIIGLEKDIGEARKELRNKSSILEELNGKISEIEKQKL